MDANAGVFEALFDDHDVLIADRLVHASIVDGMRLCKAMQDTFKHSDMAHLEEKLLEHRDRRFRVVVTDGVFSMDGDWPGSTRSCARRASRRPGVRGRFPRHGVHGEDGPWNTRTEV